VRRYDAVGLDVATNHGNLGIFSYADPREKAGWNGGNVLEYLKSL